MSTHDDRLYDLFTEALALPSTERAAFVEAACGGDSGLSARVLELMAHADASPSNFLEGESGAGLPEAFGRDALNFSPEVPKAIGRYRIIREIGRGGMGIVFEAEQDQPQRRVALKVIRGSLISPEMVRRFEQEARVLGQLHHPGIAHIYDAGSALIGHEPWPYFAMELIRGRPIDLYLLGRDPRAALELFVQICDAVQHAHERGVIHRDLKPANILVIEDARDVASESGAGAERIQTKILDFGVARVTNADLQASTLQTHTGQIVGTVGYMSPEQLAGESARVDARADVYALGVVLFKLLTGRLPFDIEGKLLPEVMRVVQDEEPTRIGSLNSAFVGDVENILIKALEKEPTRRYGSAAALAQDIRSHLAHVPIAARPPSAWYRAGKFARRHRALVGGALATFSALAAGLVLSTVAFVEASRERDAKQAALHASDAVTGFMTEMLGAADPFARDSKVTVRQVLDRAASQVGSRFEAQPQVEARLRTTIGKTYVALGLFPRAVEQLRRATECWALAPEKDSVDHVEAWVALGEALYFDRQLDEGRNVLETALRVYEERAKPSDPRPVEAFNALTSILLELGDHEHARSLLVRAEAWRRHSMPENDPRAIDLASNRAALHLRQEEYRQAAKIYRRVYNDSRREYGESHPRVAGHAASLAMALKHLGERSQAILLLETAVQTSSAALGVSHKDTLNYLNHYARLLADAGRAEEGYRILHRAMTSMKTAAPRYLYYALGHVQAKAGRLSLAESTLRKTVQIYVNDLGPDAGGTQIVWMRLIETLIARDLRTEARNEAEALVAVMQEGLPPDHPRLRRARDLLSSVGAQ